MDEAPTEQTLPTKAGCLPNWKSDTLLIAWVPVAAYFIAYSFEDAYYSRFAIPSDLVEVNINTIFTCGIYITIAFLVLKGVVEGFFPVARFASKSAPGSYWLMITGFVVLGLMSHQWRALFPWFLLVFIFILFMDMMNAGYNEDKEKGRFLQRLKGFQGFLRSLLKQASSAASSRSEPTYFEKITALAAATILIWAISSGLGSLMAMSRDTYLVSSADPSLLLMKVMDGKAICTRYEPTTNRLLRQIVILPISDNQQTEFIEKKTGPLKF